MMRRMVLAGLLLLLTATAQGATRKVTGVPELREAVKAARAGDVILLADGTYAFTDTTGCLIQDKHNLTIRGAAGHRDKVVLIGLGQDDERTQFGFKLYRSTHITIQDLTIKDVYWHSIQVNEGSNYTTLRNLSMWDAGEGPLKVTSQGATGPYSDYGLVDHCVFGYTERGTRGCVEGIDIVAAKGWTIRDSTFHNVTKGRSDDVAYGFFAKGNAQDTVIEGCTFENCDIPLSFGGGGTDPRFFRDGDTRYEHRRGLMRNNVVHGTKDVAIYMNKAVDFKVLDNTLDSTYRGADSSIDIRFNSRGLVQGNRCSQGYQLRDGGKAVFRGNVFHWKENGKGHEEKGNGPVR